LRLAGLGISPSPKVCGARPLGGLVHGRAPRQDDRKPTRPGLEPAAGRPSASYLWPRNPVNTGPAGELDRLRRQPESGVHAWAAAHARRQRRRRPKTGSRYARRFWLVPATRRRCSCQPGRDPSARLADGHATAVLLAFGHAQTPLRALGWTPLQAHRSEGRTPAPTGSVCSAGGRSGAATHLVATAPIHRSVLLLTAPGPHPPPPPPTNPQYGGDPTTH
jgi:hypothetical protein